MTNAFNITLTYTTSSNINVELPEGYTIDDVKSISDGKWGRARIILKDDTEILLEGEDCSDDFKWANEIYVYDEDWNKELDLNIID